jgi:hypothetical protein
VRRPERAASQMKTPHRGVATGLEDFGFSWVPAFLIRFLEARVLRDESGDDIGQVRFLGSAERRCASS